ncbi:MAG: T9SS type A sorting domain-containing protein [Candidatus Neomarinimicrobiota bacterium]
MRSNILRRVSILIILLFFTQAFCSEKYAGFRASRILGSYPNREFPSPEYWEGAAKQMVANLPAYEPAGLWIVSIYLSDPKGYTLLNFPSDGAYPDSVYYRSVDQNEDWLSHFDKTGVSIWLQVEPGGADIDTLISIVLNRYKHHSCVKGFGIDVEWYQTHSYSGGRKVTNEEAEGWEKKVKSIDPNYTLFLKHYSPRWMPATYRGDICFVDDSQNFNWGSSPFNNMLNEFKSWGQRFAPNPVAFQYGYDADKNWWSEFSDPPKHISTQLDAQISNCRGLFWVDFTICDVFSRIDGKDNFLPGKITLGQNFPNPFNPSTKIPFSIPQDTDVSVSIFDLKGRVVRAYPPQFKQEGHYEINWHARNLPSGIYYYSLTAGEQTIVKKCLLIK